MLEQSTLCYAHSMCAHMYLCVPYGKKKKRRATKKGEAEIKKRRKKEKKNKVGSSEGRIIIKMAVLFPDRKDIVQWKE